MNYFHKYEYINNEVIDCLGDKMDSIDEYVEEMNHLMGKIRELRGTVNETASELEALMKLKPSYQGGLNILSRARSSIE
jgi:hypothetical protein